MAGAEELQKKEAEQGEVVVQVEHQEDQEQQQEHEAENGGVGGVVGKEMKPWEQHSAVISIPRYDYNAPSTLLQLSHSGFLITCPIKREKSATKEAISILAKYVESNVSNCLESHDASENVKRRKLCVVEEEESAEITENELSKDESLSSIVIDNSAKETMNLVLVKVTRSGLVLFTFPKSSSFDPVAIVSDINRSLESGALKRPLWCHRILPIQSTCRLNEKEVSSTVSNLVLNYVDGKTNRFSRPLKFAVSYCRRGIEETEMKGVKGNSGDPNSYLLLDRNKCFSTVAAAVKATVSDSAVDLKSPELCVFVEVLPLSGVQNGSLVAAISVLPRELVSIKPRLCVKALVSDPKAKKEVC